MKDRGQITPKNRPLFYGAVKSRKTDHIFVKLNHWNCLVLWFFKGVFEKPYNWGVIRFFTPL
jgi:hypothetical protein